MIVVADPKRLAEPPANDDHPHQVKQRHTQHQQRADHGDSVRRFLGIEVRENGQHREQVAHEMAAGITEKGRCLGEIVREKSQQSAADGQRQQSDQVLAMAHRDDRKPPGGDCSNARAKAVHVVHEVQRVDQGQHPEHSDGIAEHDAGNEEGDAHPRCRHGQRDQQLAAKLPGRAQLMPVIQPAQDHHADGAADDREQLPFPLTEAVTEIVDGGLGQHAKSDYQ